MNLPFLNKNQPERSFFLSLLIKPYKVAAILFEEVGDKLLILSTNETPIEADIDQVSSEELLHASDKTISACEVALPEGESVEKTIFSVPYDWIEESKIKSTYLDRLKNVCTALDLIPIGYLTSIEAIVHFIDKSEGAPVSAVFFEITKNRVFAYLVKAGKIIHASSETVSESILASSEELLKKFSNIDVLPAKIILLDLENSSEIQQEFLSHKWSGIPFLHVPQVVVLEKGFENEAVVNGVATQMELAVADSANVVGEFKKAEGLDAISESQKNAEFERGEDFGFVKEADIRDQKSEVGSDSEGDENVEPLKQPDLDVNYFKEHEGEIEQEAFGREERKPISFNLAPFLAVYKKIKLPTNLNQYIRGSKSGNKIIATAVVVIVFILLFSFLYYNFLLKADIMVFSDQKAVSKTADIAFTTDPTGDEIKLNIVSEEIKGSEEKNATGKKETGDKAKGSLTIYNKTEDSKTFSKGTTLVGPNNLEFVITDDVKIASTSSFSTSLSSASVKVEAAKFGKEYNLPSGSNFTVKGFSTSDYIAKNSDATSGGSSKTTTVVSKKDLSDLLSLITQKLTGDAISKAQSEISGNEAIMTDPLSSDIKKQDYSKKEGDEASSVSLEATIVYNVGKYNKNDIENVVKNISKNEVPGTYVLQEGESKIDIEDIKVAKDGESASAKLKINAVYSPQIDSNSLAKSLKGKSQGAADKKIREITGVSDVNIKFRNQIPPLPSLLPFNSKNITVEIKY